MSARPDRLRATERDETLIRSLSKPEAYPHPAPDIEVLETHISWVVLAGEFAYKIKKPVRLGFLDFSTLDLRRRFCEEELRLNRQWAPQIYLDVVPISGTDDRPRVGGDGPSIEYAVKMLRFPQQAILAAELEAGRLTGDDMIEIAEMLAARHGQALQVRVKGEDAVLDVSAPMLENFDYLVDRLEDGAYTSLKQWTETSLRSLDGVLRHRAEAGFVRECHGDLHLGNLVRLPAGIVAFDCIEFDAALRTIDVVSDVAFLVMDLVANGRRDLAYGFLNRYFECTGDYDGVRVLALYVVYHCLIRAKVLAIRSAERSADRDRRRDLDEMRHYCDVASDWMPEHVPALLITCGLSGSGKTWLSSRIMLSLPAIHIRSDIERRRLAGIDETTRSSSGVGRGIYAPAMTRTTYDRLLQAARPALQSGMDVILDASFLRRSDRSSARRLAEDYRAAFLIVELRAPGDVLAERVKRRMREGRDASEADASVLEHQLAIVEGLDEAEHEQALQFDTSGVTDAAEFVDRVRAAIGRPLSDPKV
jgi:aminoglycoside phosphotransferase family enzyme/predicted kinase